jgi:hypothetical protein
MLAADKCDLFISSYHHNLQGNDFLFKKNPSGLIGCKVVVRINQNALK